MHSPFVDTPPRITIGVPTYNREKLLLDCLTNISQQTYGDYIVLISDNASTDRTAEIVKDFASKDHRFRYIRQETNIGPLLNFNAVLKAANTPLFIWRADDDLWPPDYLEKLVATMDANPEAKLAVAKVLADRMDGTKRRVINYNSFDTKLFSRMRRLLHYHPCWIYGLFERTSLTEIMDIVCNRYQETRYWDQLVLFYYFFKNLAVGTNETHFDQRIDSLLQNDGRPLSKRAKQITHLFEYVDGHAPEKFKIYLRKFQRVIIKRIAKVEMFNFIAKLRSRFFEITRGWIEEDAHNRFERLIWRIFMWVLVGKRTSPARRVLKYKITCAILRI
jgi:glycosyltransferase involved in cell wall biosynthesis